MWYPDQVKKKIQESGLAYNQIYDVLGYSGSWFYKAFDDNPTYALKNPNQIRLQAIVDYIDAYDRFRNEYKETA